MFICQKYNVVGKETLIMQYKEGIMTAQGKRGQNLEHKRRLSLDYQGTYIFTRQKADNVGTNTG